jgi:ubiquitin carboxyl-terminal hydrolase 7
VVFAFVRFVGRLFVKANGRPTDILERLCEMAGFAPNEELRLFEVYT